MNGWYVIAVAGMVSAGGLVALVRAVRPWTPSLAGALSQLSASTVTRTRAHAVQIEDTTSGQWLPGAIVRRLERYAGASDADLAVVGWTRQQLIARKVVMAAMFLVMPLFVSVAMVVMGVSGIAAVPALVGVVMAAVGWMLPTQTVREDAASARARFRTSLEFYLTLVAGERRARGSVEQALGEAAAVSDSREFAQMRQVIRRATLAGRKPWADLRELGEELDIAELRQLADIAEVASDGASVYQTLLASAASLRAAELNDARAEANSVSERMSRPLAVLVLGLTLMVLFPVLLRMVGTM